MTEDPTEGDYALKVTIACERCGGTIFAQGCVRSQDKQGQWDATIHIPKGELGAHHCSAKSEDKDEN